MRLFPGNRRLLARNDEKRRAAQLDGDDLSVARRGGRGDAFSPLRVHGASRCGDDPDLEQPEGRRFTQSDEPACRPAGRKRRQICRDQMVSGAALDGLTAASALHVHDTSCDIND